MQSGNERLFCVEYGLNDKIKLLTIFRVATFHRLLYFDNTFSISNSLDRFLPEFSLSPSLWHFFTQHLFYLFLFLSLPLSLSRHAEFISSQQQLKRNFQLVPNSELSALNEAKTVAVNLSHHFPQDASKFYSPQRIWLSIRQLRLLQKIDNRSDPTYYKIIAELIGSTWILDFGLYATYKCILNRDV